MKTILFYCLSLLSFSAYSKLEIIDYAKIVSYEKDTTLKVGQSKLLITITNSQTGERFENVKIHLDTNTYIGKSNANGELFAMVLSGNKRFCADTPLNSSVITQFNFSSQYVYTIQVSITPTVITTDPVIIYDVVEKPVIYLYPTEKTKINIQVKPKDEFLFTYPKYTENGWTVIAKPNGDLSYNNRSYNYLFWEGVGSKYYNFNTSTGFIVKSDTLVEFFENSLTQLGLSTKEQADFITYWAPRLEQNTYNFIHFDINDDYSKHVAELIVTPQPETIIRVFMTYHSTSENDSTITQNLPTLKRKGFTVVEWGGSIFNIEKHTSLIPNSNASNIN